MFAKLWNDEAGTVAVEYLFLTTIVGLGLVVGFGNLEAAINAEYTELGQAILALDQGWTINDQSGCVSAKSGGGVSDEAGSVGIGSSSVANTLVFADKCASPAAP